MCLSNEHYNMSYILLQYQLNQCKTLNRKQIEIKPAMKSFIKKPQTITNKSSLGLFLYCWTTE